jgi:hypothetical protein
VGGAGPAALAVQTQRPWLSGGTSESSVATPTICRIVTCPRNYLKFTAGWCRPWRRRPPAF